MINFYRWLLINLILPLTPFLTRLFIFYMGKEGRITWAKIMELPEIVFFSIYICIINLNINLDGTKGWFEITIRLFFFIIISLDCLTLGMIYSNNTGYNMTWFVLAATVFPTLIAPIYKFRYLRLRDL